MANKVVIREYWEEIVVRKTDVCIIDDENYIIEAETIREEHVETVESGDIDTYVPTIRNHSYFMDDYNRFKEEHKDLLNESQSNNSSTSTDY